MELIRAKAGAENKVRTLEQTVKTLNIEIEEYREVKINMEKLIMTLKEESADWKKKYDTGLVTNEIFPVCFLILMDNKHSIVCFL